MNKGLLYIGGAALLYLLLKPKKGVAATVSNVAPDIGGNVPPSEIIGDFSVPTETEIKSVLREIKQVYGDEMAKNVERIYRLETAHFTSGQFKKSGSPGMLKHSDKFPYGWTTPYNNLWKDNPDYAPVGEVSFMVNNKKYTYLVFPNFKSAAFTLASYLDKYPPGRWYSTVPSQQAEYVAKLNRINTPYSDFTGPLPA